MVYFFVYGDVIVGIACIVTENSQLMQGIAPVDLLSDCLSRIRGEDILFHFGGHTGDFLQLYRKGEDITRNTLPC